MNDSQESIQQTSNQKNKSSIWIWILIAIAIIGVAFVTYQYFSNTNNNKKQEKTYSNARNSITFENNYANFKKQDFHVVMDLTEYFESGGKDEAPVDTLDTHYYYQNGRLLAQSITKDPTSILIYGTNATTYVIHSVKTYGPLNQNNMEAFVVPGGKDYNLISFFYSTLIDNETKAKRIGTNEYEFSIPVDLSNISTVSRSNDSTGAPKQLQDHTLKYTFDNNGNLTKINITTYGSNFKEFAISFEYTKISSSELTSVLTIPKDYKESID